MGVRGTLSFILYTTTDCIPLRMTFCWEVKSKCPPVIRYVTRKTRLRGEQSTSGEPDKGRDEKMPLLVSAARIPVSGVLIYTSQCVDCDCARVGASSGAQRTENHT